MGSTAEDHPDNMLRIILVRKVMNKEVEEGWGLERRSTIVSMVHLCEWCVVRKGKFGNYSLHIHVLDISVFQDDILAV